MQLVLKNERNKRFIYTLAAFQSTQFLSTFWAAQLKAVHFFHYCKNHEINHKFFISFFVMRWINTKTFFFYRIIQNENIRSFVPVLALYFLIILKRCKPLYAISIQVFCSIDKSGHSIRRLPPQGVFNRFLPSLSLGTKYRQIRIRYSNYLQILFGPWGIFYLHQ